MDVRDRQILSESSQETLAGSYDFRRHNVDVLCGGFPCQDISNAGKRAGMAGSRSGLWRYMVRAVRMVRPKYVIVENVAALLGRGMGDVLGDLAESGYDSEWNCIPACAVGAQHLRERIWIVAHINGDDGGREFIDREIPGETSESKNQEPGKNGERVRPRYGDGVENFTADPMREGLSSRSNERANRRHETYFSKGAGLAELASQFDRSYWRHQPLLGRGFYGLPQRVDRIKSLGNSVVPQIVEWIGKQIMKKSESPAKAE